MENQEAQTPMYLERIKQLEEKNQALEEKITRLLSQHESRSAIEKRYEESQERFRTIFEQSQFGNKIITSNLEIIKANNALHEMLGFSAQELVGTRIIDRVHPDNIPAWHDLQENLWTKRIPFFQIETCMVRKDGSHLRCQVTSILFRDNQATLGYTTLEDISVRKDLEDLLAKQTELINADLDNFIYVAHHDLKAPIANIEGLLSALNGQLVGELSLTKEQSQLLSMIGIASDKLKATIADLTQIARIQKEAVAAEVIPVEALFEEVYGELHALIGQTPVKLSKQLDVREICFVRKHLQGILYHLLSNAIKYRSAERPLAIAIQTRPQGKYTLLAVTDNGLGMAESQVPKLFTMFKRFHTHVEGTGIGLYMVKRMIENAGGRIEVESQLGVGTIVRVYLPHPTGSNRTGESWISKGFFPHPAESGL